MTSGRKLVLVRGALAAVSLVTLVTFGFAVLGWLRVGALEDGFEHGFELAGTYDGDMGATVPSWASFVVKGCDGYDGLWQLSCLESGSRFQHEEGWLRRTEDPNLYYLIGQDGSQRGWVAVSGLTGVFGQGRQVVVGYASAQLRFSCTSFEPSLESAEGSVGYAGSSLSDLGSDEWFSGSEKNKEPDSHEDVLAR